ncbi:LexA family transcriptional regulator [Bengtsoniella intestinalis]|uniref:XRE family transcriptional regulator n=1 Tax=Bengtsoniella intestinalis TaxID=3073143 RepID=UPI00391FAE71
MDFGTQIRDRRKELGLSRSDVAQSLGVSISAIGNYENSINFPSEKVMLRLFDCLQIQPNELYKDSFQGGEGVMTHSERQMMEQFRPLSPSNKDLVRNLIDALWQSQQEALPSGAPVREIPLYQFPAAAGYVAPVFNTDFEYLSVRDNVPPAAEFAVRIQGDSMEPYITDGSVVYVNRDPLRDGDIGIFWVDGDMFCKQYHADSSGTVYLLSLNRNRSDADVALPSGSERSFTCFGRVMMNPPPVAGM